MENLMHSKTRIGPKTKNLVGIEKKRMVWELFIQSDNP